MPQMTEKERADYYEKHGTRYKAVVYDPKTGAVDDEAEYDDLNEAIGFARLRDWDAVIDQATGKTVWHR